MEASDVSGTSAPEGSSSPSYPPVPEADRVAESQVGEDATNAESERQQDEAAKAAAGPEAGESEAETSEPEAQTGTDENVAGVAGSEVTGGEVAEGNDGETVEESDES